MNNKVLKKIIGLTDKVKTMADKKTIIKLKTLKESANRDFTEADLAQREVGFNEKDNILYFRRSDGTIVKVETPTPEQLQLQYNGSEIAQYDGNINTTANFIINSENIPLSETDSTTVSEELEKKLEADVLELYVSLESYNKFNDIMFGSIDWEQSYENGFIPQLIVNVEQSFFDDLGNPENIDGKPYNPTSNNYKIGSTYLCIGGFDSTLTFKYDLWTAGNLPNESGYIINSIASAMSLLDDKFPNYYTKSEADSKLAEKLDISVASTTYATKEELNNKVSSVYKYKGSVATEEELPSANNEIGDVYNVETDGMNYAWDGTTWDKLGVTVDLSNYYTKPEVNTELDKKLDITTATSTYATITSVNGKADKATTLAGYGITDAYTSSEVDSKLDTKQNTLSIEQLAAVNSGITAEHITSYDAYAGEISAAQLTADKADKAAEVAQQTANLVGTNLQTVTEKIPTSASSSNLLVDTNAMNTALANKANASDLGTMSAKNASDYSTKAVADTLYAPIRKSVTDTSSTTITLANADANTVYHYGTLDSLTITAADVSDLETIIWFTPSANLTNIVIPDTIKPMNEFKPVSGKLCCLSILNGTVVYGSIL